MRKPKLVERIRLKLALPLVVLAGAASAQPLPWRGDGESCEGAHCCLSGSSKPGKTCVVEEAQTLPAPDGKGEEQFHYVRRSGKNGVNEWGMADADGDVFAKVGPGRAVALNSRTLLRCYGDCELLRKGEKPARLGALAEVALENGTILRLFFVEEGGRGGYAPLLPDMTLGKTIWGLSGLDPIGFEKTAAFRVQESSTEPAVSALIDAAGAVVAVVPEMRSYLIPNNAIENGSDGRFWRSALLVAGPSPADFGGPDKTLYHPADPQTGLPIKLRKGVIGYMAARLTEPPILGGYYKTDARVARIWVEVEKTEKGFLYRMDGGDGIGPTRMSFNSAKLPAMDSLGYTDLDAQGGHARSPYLVGRRADGGGWQAFDGWDRGAGETAELAAMDLLASCAKRNDRDAKLAAELERIRRNSIALDLSKELAKQQAYEESLRKFYSRWEPRLKAHEPCGDWSSCRDFEAAAIALGEPYVTEWFQNNQIYGGQMSLEKVCRLGRTTACDLAQKSYEENLAEGRRQSRLRANAEARQNAYLRGMVEAAARMPDVTVGSYEGGRLVYKTMSWENYQGVYGR